MIGQTLGRYRILEKIGAGGMGEVYRARDERLDRDVALKVLPAGLLADEAARQRFRREALALGKLNHPNIQSVFDFDTQNGIDFLITEYVPGVTLNDRLAGKGLPEKEVLRLGQQLAEGLAAAHEQGIVHRDLKPSNLRVTPDGRLKILDFGLAKLVRPRSETAATETGTRSVAGTPLYMAPEQQRGEKADARSDLYSAGLVLWETATGKPPVAGRALSGEVSPDWRRIVEKCLEEDPENRYQSAKELAVDLRRLGTRTPPPTVSRGQEPVQRQRRASRKRIRSLAVLPLANLSRDPEQEYFADGMTEALITDLSKIGALKVISRTSAMRYKGSEKSVPEIARELNVDAILEGSVLRVAERVRITAQLIHAATDEHVWAESYERNLSDVLALQSDVARAIAEEIKIKLTPQEQVRLASARALNPEAHDAYLRGRFHWNKRAEAAVKKAIEYFQQAIESDPGYAMAYVGLADAYSILGYYGLLPPKESFPKAKAAALRALELDNTLGEAHTSLGYALYYYDWDWVAAEKEFQRALELNPRYPEAHLWYGNPLTGMGRHEEALSYARRARELDPLSVLIIAAVGWLAYYARQYGETIEQCRKAIEMDPNFAPAHLWLGMALEQTGKYDEALEESQKAVAFSGGSPHYRASLGYTYALSGRADEARKVLDELNELSGRMYVSPYYRAEIHAGLGEREEALACLGKAYEERANLLVFLKVEPRLDPLRGEPRFQALLRRMNFPE